MLHWWVMSTMTVSNGHSSSENVLDSSVRERAAAESEVSRWVAKNLT